MDNRNQLNQEFFRLSLRLLVLHGFHVQYIVLDFRLAQAFRLEFPNHLYTRRSRAELQIFLFENMIWENQAAYYRAIEDSTERNDSGIFVDFILESIFKAINSYKQDVGVNVGVNEQQLLNLIAKDCYLTASLAAEALSISKRQAERLFSSLKEKGLIRRIEL